MSSSSEYSEFPGQKPAKSPEKSTFSQTCSLLSQYIKEKGSFGDLSLGMTCNTEPSGSPETSCQSATTMNLFPTKENNVTPKNLTAMDLFSSQAAYRPNLPAEEIPTLINSSAIKSVTKGPKAAQLTIFYAGQVIVFDDFPSDKANELISFAGKGISQSQNNSLYTYTQSQPSFPSNLVRTSADSSTPVIPSVNIVPSTGTNSIHEHPQASSRPVVCDLPIARKASLHRFLEKRKDRIAAKAPYQLTNPMGSANKPAESMSWLGLGAKSPQV
ncbi:protein TIFY 10A-like [Gastrolobium bilobum]|uniref:protein TIFY 10A-like n=1 Tax=Gastrolobium bilobum TaxID=150636 RepID=UPI002AB2DE14|nr:protein TIFY 10A-like [Gastrolobium bilobum]